MQIKKLKLKNFRNYNYLDINLNESTNIFYGDNAQGKTNLLEAIYMLATSKSHRRAKDNEMISFGKDEAFISGYYKDENQDFSIDIHLKEKKSKGIAINKIPLSKNNDLMGQVNVIVFSPEDLSIIKSSPQKRRNFIDSELCQLSKIYLYNLTLYKKTLNQRNILLKAINKNKHLEKTLSVWDIQLAKYGSEIIKERKKFIKDLSKIASKKLLDITNKKEKLEISYDFNIDVDNILDALAQNHQKDIIKMSTTIGPHRDDLNFFINNINVKTYGSQGQQKTVALVLKISEIELVKNNFNKSPILLLDDVLSELDRNRQSLLLNLVKDNQTIITCTGLKEFIENKFNMHSVFMVKDGYVINHNEEEI